MDTAGIAMNAAEHCGSMAENDIGDARERWHRRSVKSGSIVTAGGCRIRRDVPDS